MLGITLQMFGRFTSLPADTGLWCLDEGRAGSPGTLGCYASSRCSLARRLELAPSAAASLACGTSRAGFETRPGGTKG